MRMVMGIIAIAIPMQMAAAGSAMAPMKNRQYAQITCFKSGEQVSGMNKICFYDCLGSQAAITISSAQLCPLTIQR